MDSLFYKQTKSWRFYQKRKKNKELEGTNPMDQSKKHWKCSI